MNTRAGSLLSPQTLGESYTVIVERFDGVLERARALHGAAGEDHVFEAMRWAIDLHGQQVDKRSRPYLCHIAEVAANVASLVETPSAAMLCAALLHDSLEDCMVGLAEKAAEPTLAAAPDEVRSAAEKALLIGFGEHVRDLVITLTNPDFGELDEDALLDAYDQHFAEILDSSEEAAMVKICDFRANAFNLHEVRDADKRVWLVRKYARPLRRTIDFLERHRPLGGALLDDARLVWSRDYAAHGPPLPPTSEV